MKKYYFSFNRSVFDYPKLSNPIKFFFFIVVFFLFQSLNAQNVLFGTKSIADLSPCQGEYSYEQEFQFFGIGPVASRPDTALVSYDLFSNLQYSTGSIVLISNSNPAVPVVVTEFDTSNLNQPVFKIATVSGAPLSFGQSISIGFVRSGDCTVANLGAVNTQDDVSVDYQSVNFSDVNNFNINDPSLVLQDHPSLSPDTVVRLNIDTVCVPFQIVNAGLGDLRGVTLRITNQDSTRNHKLIVGDTTLDFSTVGIPTVFLDFETLAAYDTSLAMLIADSNLTNGERLTVYHCFTVVNCALSTWDRIYDVSYGCNAAICQASVPYNGVRPVDGLLDERDFIDPYTEIDNFSTQCADGLDTRSAKLGYIMLDSLADGTLNPFDSVIIEPRFRSFTDNTFYVDTNSIRAYYASNPGVSLLDYEDMIPASIRAAVQSAPCNNLGYVKFNNNDFFFLLNYVDIVPGDTLMVDFEFIRCCDNGESSCSSNYNYLSRGEIIAYIRTQCNSRVFTGARLRNFLPTSYNSVTSAVTASVGTPSLVDGGTSSFCYSWDYQSSDIRGMNNVVEIVIPEGLSIDTAGLLLTRNNVGDLADSIWISATNDTLRVFDLNPQSTAATPATYELCYDATLSCGVLPTGFVSSSFSYGTQIGDGSCPTCSYELICDETVSFFIACNNNCPKGIIIDEQIVERTNFGYVDSDNDNIIDATIATNADSLGVRADRLISGDTLASLLSLGIKTGGDTISTIYVEQTFNNGEYFEFIEGFIEVFDSSAATSYSASVSLTDLFLGPDTVGNSQDGNVETFTFYVDVSNFQPGFLFEDSDSIQLNLFWRMLPHPDHFFTHASSIRDAFIPTKGYTADALITASFVVSSGNVIDTATCTPGLDFNSFTEVSSGMGLSPYADDELDRSYITSGGTSGAPQSCSGVDMINMLMYAGLNPDDESAFPNEVREIAKPDTIYFDLDSLVRVVTGGVSRNYLGTVDSVTYWVENVTTVNQTLGSTQSGDFSSSELDTVRVNLPMIGPDANGKHYVAFPSNLYVTNGGGIQIGAEGFAHRIKFHLTQKEECVFSNANNSDVRYLSILDLDWQMGNFDSTGTYDYDNRLADNGNVMNADNAVFSRTFSPRFSNFSSQTIVMNTATKDITGSIDVRYIQTPYLFVFADYDTSTAQVNYAYNQLTGDTVFATEYANGAFIPLDTLYSSDNTFFTFNFSLTSCQSTTIDFRPGASCNGYPTDLNGLDLNSDCIRREARVMTLLPTPAIVQAEMFDQPRDTILLCESDTVGIRINSAGNSDVVNPYMVVPLIEGISFSEITIDYLGNSQIAVFDTLSGAMGDSIRIFLNQHTDLNDIPGSIQTTDTFQRQVLVTFAYSTSCEATSGSAFDLIVFGSNSCSEPAIGSGSVISTEPVNIVLGSNYNFIGLPSVLPSVVEGCKDTIPFNIEVVMIPDRDPSAISNGEDLFIIELPSFLNFDSTSYVCSSDSLECDSLELMFGVNTFGNDSITINIPSGVELGDQFNIAFDFISNFGGSCASNENLTFTILGATSETSPTCFADTGTFFCSDAIAINRFEEVIPLEIQKSEIDSLLAVAFVRDSILSDGDNVAFSGSFDIISQDLISGDSIVIEAYCLDTFGNEIGGVLGSTTVYGPIIVGDNVSFDISEVLASCPGLSAFEIRVSPSREDGSLQCVCDVSQVIPLFSLIIEPLAINDTAIVPEDSSVVVVVLTNDSLPDSTLASVTVTVPASGNPNNGTVVVDSTGAITYTPDSNYIGIDSFTYIVCDSSVLTSLCDTALVFITVTPVTDTLSYTIPEDSSIVLCDTLLNGINADSVTVCNGGANGSSSIAGNCITYMPIQDYNGEDTLCYVVCNDGQCDTTIVIMEILPVNDPIIAINDTVSLNEDDSVSVVVLANDLDVDNNIDTSSVSVLTNPGFGTVSVNPDGTITYTPIENFIGMDEFVYAVCDTGMPVYCDTASVFLNILPQIDTFVVTTEEETPIDICMDSLSVFAGLITNINTCGLPDNGVLTPGLLPCIEYSPNAGFIGLDTMCVITCSGMICDTSYIIVNVTSLNDPPNAVDDLETTEEDSTVTIAVLGNDTDLEGPLDTTSVSVITGPSNGSTTVNADGTIDYTPNSDFVGVDMFTYAVCDTGMPILCDTAVVSINVTSVPDTVTVMVPEDSVTTLCTNDNFVDPTLVVSICGSPDNGGLSNTVVPCIDYTPNSGYVGMDTACIVTCSANVCDTTIFVIEVTPVNDPPVALDDDTTTMEDVPVVVNVVGNDSDLEGPLDTASVGVVTGPSNGSTTVNADGTITYTPDADFVGVDMYTYAVCDTGMPVLCDTAVVTINATPVTDTSMTTTPENTPVVFCTDSVTNLGAPITSISTCGGGINGSVSSSILPCVTYTPNTDFVGMDTICLVTCSGVVCDTTIVVITVTDVIIVAGNNPPNAVDDLETTEEDSTVTIAVLGNDTDLEGPLDTTSVSVITGPSNGSTTVNADGTIDYTPNSDFVGVDMFTYAVCDTGMPILCDTAVVSINVTSVPDTVTVMVPEDSVTTLCTNDNFVDPTLVVSICGAPDNGTLSNTVVPCIDYTPSSGFVGMDTACIVTCSATACDTTIFVIAVTPVNDPPVAIDDDTTTMEDTPVVVNVFTNDSDLEGPLDTATVSVITNPTNGMVVDNGDGTITYTPDPNFVGVDMYTYAVCDTGSPVLCDTAVVTITITSAPDTIMVTVPEDGTETVCTGSSVNFADPITSVSLCDAPDNGTTAPGILPCIEYTPNAGYVGPDTMCIVTCAGVYCDTTIVLIDVTPVNDPPVAVDDVTNTPEDTPVDINVLVNDSDVEGPLDTTSLIEVTPPMNGTISIDTITGIITYTPDSNFVGTDMFVYAVCDTGLPVLCDTATVTINVPGVPDTSIVTTPEDTPLTLCTDSLTNFTGPIDLIQICGDPVNGMVDPTFLPCVIYTPDADYVGLDSMCIVSCSAGICDTTFFVIDVTPVNDPPVAVDNDTTTLEDTPVVVDVINNDYDLEGPLDSASVSIVTGPTNGTAVPNGDGTITYTPDPDFVGTDMYTYAVCDTGAPILCDTAIVTITITSAPDTTLLTLPEDSMIVLCTDSLTNFADPITSISLCGAPSNGAITQEFLPCVTYTPNPDYWGPDTTCLITCAGAVCDTTYVFITVTPIIDVPVLDPVEDICETEPIPALTGTVEAGSVIQWIENGAIIGTGSPFTPPATPGENCYQAVAFNATLGMTSLDTAEVCFNIDSLPTNVNAGPDDTICGFQDYELQATGNGRLVFWTQIVGQQVSLDLGNPNAIVALEPNNNPGTDNIYTFAWTNTNGLCSVSDTVTIWVTNPHFTDAGNDTSICVPEAGGSVQLNATLTPGATGWWNYVGSENITFVDSTDAQTVVNGLVPYNNTASTYLFEWFEQIADCIARDEVIITVNEAPRLTVLDADTFCLGSDYILDADITGISQASYSWRLDGPTGTILSWDEDAVVSPLVNTTYYVVASVAFGQSFCTTIDSLELFVDGLPIAVDDGCYDLFEDSLLTGTTNDWLANDDISAVITGNVGFEVLNGGSVLDPASVITIDNTTDTYVYTPFLDMSGVDSVMIVIFNEACPDLRDTFVVCFNVIPVTDDPIVAMPDTFNIVAGSTVTFPILDNDTLNGQAVDTVITILLDPIYGSIDTPIVGGQVVYNSETEFASVDSFQYVVCQYLVDGEELCDTTTVIVLVDGELYIPEGFTPNGDGINDGFEIPNLELLYPNATLQIYNRWGDEVWNSEGPYRNDWDGTNFNDSQLPDGTYFYIVKLNNGSDRSMASYVVIFR